MGMSVQLLRYPQQLGWMLKLNHASGTSGLAVLDLSSLHATQAALYAAVRQLLDQGFLGANEMPQQQQQQRQPQHPEELFAVVDFTDLFDIPAGVLQPLLDHLAVVLGDELPLGLLLAQMQHWQSQAAAEIAAAGRKASEGLAAPAAVTYLEALKQQVMHDCNAACAVAACA